jgi:hypothetical protein
VTALTVPDVLRRAEQVVAERGHHKGWYIDDNRERVCMMGACAVAIGMIPDPKDDDKQRWAGNWTKWSLFMKVWDAVKLTVEVEPSRYNDAEERTEAEVRAALLAAAQRAEAGT